MVYIFPDKGEALEAEDEQKMLALRLVVLDHARMEERMKDLSNTRYFKVQTEPDLQVEDVLNKVYEAMTEKGYNPVNQIVGYIMSGDPTYITSHKNARSLIMKVERDELVEALLKSYIKNNHLE